MSTLLVLLFLFFIGSLFGWCLELIFRRFFSDNNPERKWINPGFLIGPYLPLYGFGLCILYLLASVDLEIIANPVLRYGVRFLVMAAGMTAIEYIAGLIFIRGMHVKLWDYSRRRGNIQGIICPLFSALWWALGILYYFAVHPYILGALTWLSRNLAFSFVIGFFYGILSIDIVYSMQLLSKIRRFASENGIVVRLEELKHYIRSVKEEGREKMRFLLSLRARLPLTEILQNYKEKYHSVWEEYKNKHKKTR